MESNCSSTESNVITFIHQDMPTNFAILSDSIELKVTYHYDILSNIRVEIYSNLFKIYHFIYFI